MFARRLPFIALKVRLHANICKDRYIREASSLWFPINTTSRRFSTKEGPQASVIEFEDFSAAEAILKELPPVKVDGGQHSKNDLESIGKAFFFTAVVVSYMRQERNMRFETACRSSKQVTDTLIKKCHEFGSKSLSEYIGHICINDYGSANAFIALLLQSDKRSDNFPVDYTTNTHSDFPFALDTENIVNSTSSVDKFSIPKLNIETSKLNPLFFVDDTTASFAIDDMYSGGEKDSKRAIGEILESSKSLGKLCFECLLSIELMKTSHKSTPVKNIMKKLEQFISYSGLDILVYKVSNADVVIVKDRISLFYRYVGLFFLSRSSVTDLTRWLKLVVEESINSSHSNSSSSMALRSIELSSAESIPPLQFSKTSGICVDRIMTDPNLAPHLKALAKESIRYSFYDFIFRSNFKASQSAISTFEKKYEQLVLNTTSKLVQNSSYADPYAYIALLTIKDENQCFNYLSSFFKDNGKFKSYEYIESSIKWLYSSRKVPHITILKNFPKNESVFMLPELPNKSYIERFLLLNAAVISPKVSRELFKNNKMEDSVILHSSHKRGNSYFKFILRKYLIMLSNDQTSMFISELYRLLTSENFKKYIIDKCGIMKMIQNRTYKKALLQSMYKKNLVDCSLSQYVSTLSYKDPIILHSWMKTLITSFMELVDKLNNEDVYKLTSDLSKTFLDHKFSLYEEGKAEVLKKVSDGELRLELPTITGKDYSPGSDVIGKELLSYCVSKLHISKSLDSFMTAKKNTLDLMNKLSELDIMKKQLDNVDFIVYLSALINERGSRLAEETIFNMLRKLVPEEPFSLIDKVPHLDIMMSKHQERSKFSFFGDRIFLPSLNPESDLHKLSLINFYISRTFLRNIKAQTKNINEFPDLCTKMNTVGGHYYTYHINKAINEFCMEKVLPETIINKVRVLFLDRILLGVICDQNDILIHPFESQVYTKLAEEYIKNKYSAIRFSGQTFKQYIGGLCFTDPMLVDRWVKNLVNFTLNQLYKQDIEAQIKTLNQIEKELNAYFVNYNRP